MSTISDFKRKKLWFEQETVRCNHYTKSNFKQLPGKKNKN